MASANSLDQPLTDESSSFGTGRATWRPRLVMKACFVGAAAMAIALPGLLLLAPPSKDKVATNSPKETTESVQEVLKMFSSLMNVTHANEFFARLPSHDQEEIVIEHIIPQAERLFVDFLQNHGSSAPHWKTGEKMSPRYKFEDPKEQEHRLTIFKSNIRDIVNLNNYVGKNLSDPLRAIFGIYQFADWTWDEFQTLLSRPDLIVANTTTDARPFLKKSQSQTRKALNRKLANSKMDREISTKSEVLQDSIHPGNYFIVNLASNRTLYARNPNAGAQPHRRRRSTDPAKAEHRRRRTTWYPEHRRRVRTYFGAAQQNAQATASLWIFSKDPDYNAFRIQNAFYGSWLTHHRGTCEENVATTYTPKDKKQLLWKIIKKGLRRFLIVSFYDTCALYADVNETFQDGVGTDSLDVAGAEAFWDLIPEHSTLEGWGLTDIDVRIVSRTRALYAQTQGNWESAMGAGEGFLSERENALWRITQEGDGYRIINKASQRALYAFSHKNHGEGFGAASPPSAVGRFGIWEITKVRGEWRIVNKHSNRVLYAKEGAGNNWRAGIGASIGASDSWQIFPSSATHWPNGAPCDINYAYQAPRDMFRARNQGTCGNCYAHASAETLRQQAWITTGRDPGALSVGYITACLTYRGCGGGSMIRVFNQVRSGIPTSRDYGGGLRRCKKGIDKTIATSGVYEPVSEKQIAKVLCAAGPVAISMYASKAFMHYGSGIITVGKQCPKREPNHALTVIALRRFEMGKNNFWVLRNSWGTSWGVNPYTYDRTGDGGYALVRYGEKACGIGAYGGANAYPRNVRFISEGKPHMIPYTDMVASQSSTWQNRQIARASKCLTAKPKTHWPGTCAHTQKSHDPWWKVVLMGQYIVQNVSLTNRAGCCPERLQKVNIYVDNKKCASGVNVPAGGTLMVPCNGVGSEIKVELQQDNKLTICGFAAYGFQADLPDLCCKYVTDYGVAPGVTWGTIPADEKLLWTANHCDAIVASSASSCKDAFTPMIPYTDMVASQSSTWQNRQIARASKCLTAKPKTHWPGTCAHTQKSHDPWWKVALKKVYIVQSVSLTNRAGCCPERLQKVNIYLDNKTCASGVNVPAGGTQVVPCSGSASEIKVELQQYNKLTICGFAAYGFEGLDSDAIEL